MAPYEIIRFLVWLIGLPVIALLLLSIVRRIRAIRELDARLREEESQNVSNPYAEMAKAMEAQEVIARTRRNR